jgi:hypothetical protein
MNSRLEKQALRSAAHLVAALSDRRFGVKSQSAELRDCVAILCGELDELGLLAEYRQPDGTLAAWDEAADAYSREILGRASFKDDKPSDLPHSYRVML